MARKAKKSSFRGKVSRDSEKQSAQGSNYGYLKLPKGVSIYAPTPGKREKFDIMPYEVTDEKHPDLDNELEIAVKGDLWYKRPFKVHRNVGTEEDTVVCLTSFGEKCPICEYKKKRASEKADKDELKEYRASSRNLYCIIPYDIKDYDDDEVYLFDFSQFLFQDELNEELKENDEFEIFPDLEDGYSIDVRWKKDSFAGNSFAIAGRIDFKDRKEAYDEDILKRIPNLDDVLIRLTYQEMFDKFNELDAEDDNDDNDHKSERSSKKEKKEKKSSKHPKKEKETEPEDNDFEDLTWDELQQMDAMEQMDVIKAKNLDIDTEDYDDAAELAVAIAEELDIDTEPAEKETKKKSEKKSKKEADKESAGECPNGHVFGADNDDHKDCKGCDVWDDCFDEAED